MKIKLLLASLRDSAPVNGVKKGILYSLIIGIIASDVGVPISPKRAKTFLLLIRFKLFCFA